MATITLLDGSLTLTIYHEQSDRQFDDDICLSFVEDCDETEMVFRNEETNLYFTPEQAALIVLALNRAIEARGLHSND